MIARCEKERTDEDVQTDVIEYWCVRLCR